MMDVNTLCTGNMNIVVAKYNPTTPLQATLVRTTILPSCRVVCQHNSYLETGRVDETEKRVVLVELDVLKHRAASEHPYRDKAVENAGPGNESTVVLADLFVVQGGALVVVAKEELGTGGAGAGGGDTGYVV
jgi:hypothetical protein